MHSQLLEERQKVQLPMVHSLLTMVVVAPAAAGVERQEGVEWSEKVVKAVLRR